MKLQYTENVTHSDRGEVVSRECIEGRDHDGSLTTIKLQKHLNISASYFDTFKIQGATLFNISKLELATR